MSKTIVGFCLTHNYCHSSEPSLNKELKDGKEILVWLSQFAHDKYLNVMYSLDYNVSTILRKLNLEKGQLETLLNTTKVWINPYNIQLTYIIGKFFAVKNGSDYNSPYAMFSDAGQYIVPSFTDIENSDRCFECAVEAKRVGTEVANALSVLKVTPNALISPINEFEKTYSQKFHFPKVDDYPEEIGEMAFNSLEAGLFEGYRKGGIFKNTYDYDLNNCYGFYLSKCPDIRKGEWVEVHELGDAPIGFYDGEITVTAPLSPFGFKTKELNFTPTGTWTKTMTRQQIDFLYKWKLGEYKIYYGYEWHPKELSMPANALMKRLYEIRQQSEGIAKTVYKRICVGLWGKTLEMRGDKFGDEFNPIWGSLVEVNTRLHIMDAIFKNNVVPIAIALDGIAVDRPLDLDMGSNMGQWKLSHANKDCICMNTDLCLIQGKDSPQDFAVTFDWIFEEINKDPNAQKYTMWKKRPVTLGKSLQTDIIDKLGDIVDTPRSVDVTYEVKRMFKELPKCGTDLLTKQYNDSLPLSVEMIDLMNFEETDDDLLTNIEDR